MYHTLFLFSQTFNEIYTLNYIAERKGSDSLLIPTVLYMYHHYHLSWIGVRDKIPNYRTSLRIEKIKSQYTYNMRFLYNDYPECGRERGEPAE